MDAQSSSQQSAQPAVATPSLPKGGGAIQSIGKGWGAVGSSGAASVEITLPISQGRGYAPALSLSYQSTTGNGLFGIGWNLGMASVRRRASKGVPLYTDEDVFLGPSGDVWLPERDVSGALVSSNLDHYNETALDRTYQVIRYFARVEGAFDRIERWRTEATDPGFWLVHGADGSLYVYGKRATSRHADPADASRVAEWLLEESMNAVGEHILFEYQAEDGAGLLPDAIHASYAQRYLQRVCYGNKDASAPLYLWDEASLSTLKWHFELLFDYGERSIDLPAMPTYQASGLWPLRNDPHSSFAYGFELRQLRLCQQVLMFHRFAELGESPLLTQRVLLEYRTTDLGYSFLVAAHAQAWDGTTQRNLDQRPALQFAYNEFSGKPVICTPLDSLAGLNDGQPYLLVDLYGEGLPGVLHKRDKSWLYREPIRAESGGSNAIAYGPWQEVALIPTQDSTASVRQALTDMSGDGRLDWVVAQPGMAGIMTLRPDGDWSGFVPFSAFPTEFFHSQGHMADLVGDGLSDFAMIGPRSVRLYANRRAQGFAVPVDIAHEEDRLPLLSDSPKELVAFSDLLGSGQQHLIRIRHNEVRIWPNLGRGRFDKGQLFATLPFPYDTFNVNQVRLADLDGSGASDLVYLEPDNVRVFMNKGGNGFAEPFDQPWPEGVRYDRFCQVSAVDLQGLGFSSLVLTVPHMTPRHWAMHFVSGDADTLDKPYLLNATNNNMGASGSVKYRSSAQEWLDEKQALRAAENPAVSYLPFPVHVVVKQTQTDLITGNTLTQLFAYRQGFYDAREREFRGFGLVLQTDTEIPQQSDECFTAPVLSKTWFHTGRYPAADFSDYDTRDSQAVPLGDHQLYSYNLANQQSELIAEPDEATCHEMARTLSGSLLRTEVFGLDEHQQPSVLYSVQAHRYLVRQLQPLNEHQPYALMTPLQLETISYQYEAEQLDDPQCAHSLNLAWDAYGVLTHGVTVNYARRKKPEDAPPFEEDWQQQWWRASHDEAQQFHYLNETRAEAIHLDRPQSWRLGLPYRARGNAMVISCEELSPQQISHEQFADPAGAFTRWPRTLTGLSVQRYIKCGDGEATFQALADATESAELDDHALSAYARVMTPDKLVTRLSQMGYHRMASFLPADNLNLWSVKRGFATYAEGHAFYRVMTFQPTRSHGSTQVEYDTYSLFVSKITDPLLCVTRIFHDYRVLQPCRIIDPNQNTQEADYDAFGRVWATSFYGTELGDEVGFDPLYPDERLQGGTQTAIQYPDDALYNQASATYYDANMAEESGSIPFGSATLQADRFPDDPARQIRISLVSVDGFGRILQTRQLVEDGDAYAVDEAGNFILVDGKPLVSSASPRWRVSERIEYNNKGLAVRVYRPYFSSSSAYVNDKSLREHWHHDRQLYDALGRPTITITAKGWMRRQTYRTWYTISEDENDTAEEVLAQNKEGEQS
ncbi:toxin [Pseudomonas sp. CDFA 602]|uniref:SpvB/TcaC N-terminal domain-containing protein n=1 Tax=Pseudomonas californiensis TaxID=2829823 RepID=UPI001E28E6E7|nr:SpvB/TcaC N-terminal domain-containing protein [Pseudomonas californiensis]MCD5993405.1 toxin [Pseudomonas californiensis]MCD5998804.1 toxin [Pseudomonas californiensis]